MPAKYRWSAISAALVALAVASTAGQPVFFPGVPPLVRVFAVLGVVGLFAGMALLTEWALSRDRARIALFAAVRGWDYRARDADIAARFSVFPFSPGRGGTAANVLTGRHRFHECATFTYVSRLLNPQLQRRLRRRDTRGMPLAIDAGVVLTWQAGPIGVRRLSRRLDALIDVVEAIPEDVWTSSPRGPRA